MENMPRWARVALVVALIAIAAGGSFYGYRHFTRPVTLTIAAGSIDVGCGWYFSRISRFFSNPPLPRITPRRARIAVAFP